MSTCSPSRALPFSTLLEPRFVPFEFNLDGLQSSARLGDKLRIALEPIKNPVTGDPEQVVTPDNIRSFVIPINWRSHSAQLVVCLE